MADVTIEIKGLAELDRRLSQISEAAATKIALHANDETAAVFQNAIMAYAPVKVRDNAGSDALPPGALKADIHRDVTRTGASIGPGEKTGHVAKWVERGHRLVKGGYNNKKEGRGPGVQVGRVKKHPFMAPAFAASKEAALARFVQILKEDLEAL